MYTVDLQIWLPDVLQRGSRVFWYILLRKCLKSPFETTGLISDYSDEINLRLLDAKILLHNIYNYDWLIY